MICPHCELDTPATDPICEHCRQPLDLSFEDMQGEVLERDIERADRQALAVARSWILLAATALVIAIAASRALAPSRVQPLAMPAVELQPKEGASAGPRLPLELPDAVIPEGE